ncbi:MAG: aminoglycoside phosphotransferase family protein [Asgard group archaeon]|nr:aminoglycoside phosphotransferase family protein [Asgard group archaeon]
MDNLSKEKILEVLIEIFQTEKVINLIIKDNKTVNTIVTFDIEGKKYLMKILTRKPNAEHEYYRFEKEAQLMKYFWQNNQNMMLEGKKAAIVPVPEIIHLETSDEKIGYKFLIMEYIQGLLLEDHLKNLTSDEMKKLIVNLANIIKTIHSLEYEMFGEIEDYDCPRKFYSVKSMIKANIRKDAKLVTLMRIFPSDLIYSVQKFIEENLENCNFSNKPVLVHNDFNPSNIILDEKEKWQIKAILDFEWAKADDAILEIMTIMKEFKLESENLRLFLTTYYSDDAIPDFANYNLEWEVYQLAELLNTVAVGWVYFHQTQENLVFIEKEIKRIIGKERRINV